MPSPAPVVVGAGIAGLACARAMAERGATPRVLDRGRRPGGRLASRTMHGRPVDLGASYLTAEPGTAFAAVVAGWTARGLARPWTDTFAVAGPGGVEGRTTGPLRYAAPGGLRSLAVDLADGLDVCQEHAVERIGPGPTVDGDPAPAVALALPDPQARRLLDDATAAALLGDRAWEPALAVVLGFDRREWPADLHGAFVNGDDDLAWVADDGDRRGDGAPVLVAHTTPRLARAHLGDPGAAVPVVAAAVARALGVTTAPAWTAVHRWTFARPAEPRPEPFGLRDGIGACGDGWSAPSRVAAAWTSGDALGRALAGQGA
ncbi:NAD(P)/FAD-dependent oxidoreductase [Blastococcus sp. SYSU D00820]